MLVLSEMPTTSPNTGRSRCQPMVAPSAYSVINACSSADGRGWQNPRGQRRAGSRNGGIDRPFSAHRYKIIAPTIVDDPPLAGEAMKLERVEIEVAELRNQPLFLSSIDRAAS